VDIGRWLLIVVLVLVTGGSTPPAPQRVPVVAAEAPGTVTFYGRAGTFGALGALLPSGQSASRVEVPGWAAFAQGRRPGKAVVAQDGSVLMTGVSHNDSRTVPTSGEMDIGAYDPIRRETQTLRLASASGLAIQHVVNLLGRVRSCSPQGAVAGYRAC
jgi:hypothetical protein